MISVNVKVIGEAGMAKQLADASTGIRAALRDELAAIGEDIVSRAQANAPKRTGIMASKIIWFFGERKRIRVDGSRRRLMRTIDDGTTLKMQAMPTGSVAHLMERGVNATRGPYTRREKRVGWGWTRKGRKWIENKRGVTVVSAHSLVVPKQPFFMPAVDSVGDVNARLQMALDRLGGKR